MVKLRQKLRKRIVLSKEHVDIGAIPYGNCNPRADDGGLSCGVSFSKGSLHSCLGLKIRGHGIMRLSRTGEARTTMKSVLVLGFPYLYRGLSLSLSPVSRVLLCHHETQVCQGNLMRRQYDPKQMNYAENVDLAIVEMSRMSICLRINLLLYGSEKNTICHKIQESCNTFKY